MGQQENSPNTSLIQYLKKKKLCHLGAFIREVGTSAALLVQRNWDPSEEPQCCPHTLAFMGLQGTETSLGLPQTSHVKLSSAFNHSFAANPGQITSEPDALNVNNRVRK